MFERLEGRIKWQREKLGARFSVPVRRRPLLLWVPLAACWIALPALRHTRLLAWAALGDLNDTLRMTLIALYVAGSICLALWVAWLAVGKTVIVLEAPDVRVERRLFGIVFTSRDYHAYQIRRLRFVSRSSPEAAKFIPGLRTSCVRFEVFNKELNVAMGIGEGEAGALIARMKEVYDSPNSWS